MLVDNDNVQVKRLTCADFIEALWNEGEMSTLNSELYWSGGYDSRTAMAWLMGCAETYGIELTDLDLYDVENALYECYRNDPDKSLS